MYRWGPSSREDLEGKIQHLVRLLAQEPTQQTWRVELANGYITLGQWENAAGVLHQVVVEGVAGPEVALQAYFALGIAYSKLGNLSKAIEAYGHAFAIQPQNTLILQELGNTYEEFLEQGGMLAGTNLITNGGFEAGQEGWSIYNPSGEQARYFVDRTLRIEGQGSGAIEGIGGGYHGGWYQRVRVKPNTLYLFSSWIRVEDAHTVKGRLLYWENYVEGRPRGHWAEEFSGDMEWAHKWTVFVAPESDEGVITFYPVLVTGQGQVWVDDVRLIELQDSILRGSK